MRSFTRILSVLALAALIAPSSAIAAKKPKPVAWAAKHELKGSWRAKDLDRDGLKNLQEFKLGTNPRKADSDRDGLKDGDEVTSHNNPLKPDSDRDGIKDGAEHAGVVTAIHGATVTIRQFNGPRLVAVLDACETPAVADDEELLDDGAVEFTGEEWVDEDDVVAEDTGEETVVDLDEFAEGSDCDLAPGDVLRSAEVERAGGTLYLVAFEIV